MKKLLLPNKCWMALAVVALLAVGCGLNISWIKLSSSEVAAGQELVVKANFVQEGDNNQADYYLLYAVRVPNDWTGAGLVVVDNTNAEQEIVKMVDCDAYAKFCEYCFPREGYKWVAYQSEVARKQGGNSDATVKLTVGAATGDYNIDIMAGGWMYRPSELLNEDDTINLSVAFGCNNDRSDFSEAKEGDKPVYFNSSEYLFNASTISEAEYTDRIKAMRESGVEATVTVKAGKKTLPIAPDVNNFKRDADLSVTVYDAPAEISYDVKSASATFGSDFDTPKLNNPKSFPVAYSSSNEGVATVGEDGTVTINGIGFATIKANVADKAGSASYTLGVCPEDAVVEILTPSDFAMSDEKADYNDYSCQLSEEAPSYGVRARVTDGCFQFRHIEGDNARQDAGIMVTGNSNGWIAKSAMVEFSDGVTENVGVIFAGDLKPYEKPGDLTFPVEFGKGEYNYIGIRPANGYMFADRIAIMWVPAVTPDVPVIEGFTEGEQMSEGDQITIKCKPGQNLHYIIEKQAQFAMTRAAATEGWIPAASHEYTYTLDAADLPVKVRAKAVNGAGTHESSEVAFGIDSENKPTGIDAVDAEGIDARVEWFNLQGVCVENPAQGLYIRRQGNKVEKIFVK